MFSMLTLELHVKIVCLVLGNRENWWSAFAWVYFSSMNESSKQFSRLFNSTKEKASKEVILMTSWKIFFLVTVCDKNRSPWEEKRNLKLQAFWKWFNHKNVFMLWKTSLKGYWLEYLQIFNECCLETQQEIMWHHYVLIQLW